MQFLCQNRVSVVLQYTWSFVTVGKAGISSVSVRYCIALLIGLHPLLGPWIQNIAWNILDLVEESCSGSFIRSRLHQYNSSHLQTTACVLVEPMCGGNFTQMLKIKKLWMQFWMPLYINWLLCRIEIYRRELLENRLPSGLITVGKQTSIRNNIIEKTSKPLLLYVWYYSTTGVVARPLAH